MRFLLGLMLRGSGKPPVREMSGPTEDAALYLDEMIVDD